MSKDKAHHDPSTKVQNHPSHKASPVHEHPPRAPRKRRSKVRKFVWEFLVAIAAHTLILGLLAVATTAWLYFSKDPSLSWWVLIFALVLVVLAYFALISFQYFFPGKFLVRRNPRLHFSLLAVVVVIVTAPLAMLQSFTRARTDELLAENKKLQGDIDNLHQTQEATDSKRIRLSSHVTDSLTTILNEQMLKNSDLYDLLNICIESISLNQPHDNKLRGAVMYLDKTGRFLVVPDRAYYGYGLNQNIQSLYFKVLPQGSAESEDSYLDRLGVAGWAFTKKKILLAENVQTPKPNEPWHYKVFDEKDADQAMICVPIPSLKDRNVVIGVLSISSLNSNVFKAHDLEVARFFAALLSRFNTPLDIPQSVAKAEGLAK